MEEGGVHLGKQFNSVHGIKYAWGIHHRSIPSEYQGTGVMNQNVNINSFWKGKSLLFDISRVIELKHSDTLGAWILGQKVMNWLQKYYYPFTNIPLLSLWISSMMISLVCMNYQNDHLYLFADCACAISTMYMCFRLLKLNKTLLLWMATAFDNIFLLVLTLIQAYTVHNMLGWTRSTAIRATLAFVSQVAAIFVDSFPMGFRDFDKKWENIITIRKRLNLRYKVNDHLEDLTKIFRAAQAGKTLFSLDNHENNISTHSWMLSEVVEDTLRPNSGWPFMEKVKYRLMIAKLFCYRYFFYAYMVGLLYSITVYITFNAHFARIDRDTYIDLPWIKLTTFELLRSTYSSGAIFYLRRMFIIVFRPFHFSSLLAPLMNIPIVPEWANYMNATNRTNFIRLVEANLKPEALNLSANKANQSDGGASSSLKIQEIKDSPSSEISEPEDIDQININQNVDANVPKSDDDQFPSQNRSRFPIYLVSGGGLGTLVESSRPLSSFMQLPEWFIKFNRAFISKTMILIQITWCTGLGFWYHFLLDGSESSLFVYAILLGPSFLSMIFLWMDCSWDIAKRSLVGFETYYLGANVAILIWMGSSFFPEGRELGMLANLALGVLCISMLVLDAIPVSVHSSRRNLRRDDLPDPNLKESDEILRDIANQMVDRLFVFLKLQGLPDPGQDLQRLHEEYDAIRAPVEVNNSKTRIRFFVEGLLTAKDIISKRQQIFSSNKLLFTFVGWVVILLLYTFISFRMIKNPVPEEVVVFGASWKNSSLIRTCIGNLIIFITRRLLVALTHPQRCVSIQKNLLRFPVTESLLSPLVSET